MDLLRMRLEDNMRNVKMTVLRRPGDVWYPQEIAKLTSGLMTDVCNRPDHPECLVLLGHHTKEQTLKILGGGTAYEVTQVTGIKDEKLPFAPSFIYG